MNTSCAIDTIVFDVGWVLVHLDFQPLLNYLGSNGQQYTMPEVIAAINLEAHERGEVSSAVLIDNLLSLTPTLERVRLKRCWLDMFTPVEAMFDLARGLSATYRVHLLSNVGELHWAHLNQLYDLRALGHGALPSFEVGVMKPDHAIYQLAEDRFALDPARTVFIDDLKQNIHTARSRGWRAIEHTDCASTLVALRELGVVYS